MWWCPLCSTPLFMGWRPNRLKTEWFRSSPPSIHVFKIKNTSKIKNRVITLWPSKPYSAYISPQIENFYFIYSQNCMHSYVHCYIIYSGQSIETAEMSFDVWLEKEEVVRIYNKILLSRKKRLSAAICDAMDGSWEYHAEWNKTQKVKNHIISFICGI